MMDKSYCIFDMDGTLVDSMPWWQGLGAEYLERRGIGGDHRDAEEIQSMTMLQGAEHYMRRYRLPGPPEAILEEMVELMGEHYLADVPLKAGAADFLEKLAGRGARMCVATATAEPMARACLERLGIAKYFDFLISCETLGVSKAKPHVYLACARRLGCRPEEAAVFEDALYAARTARGAGFYTVAVYDHSARGDWAQLERLCHRAIRSWEELL